jgi:hypothetical protein
LAFVANFVSKLYALVLVSIVAPPQSALAQSVPSVFAEIGGYTAVGQEATIPESEWVPIAVTRNDGILHAEASGDGGSFFTNCTIPCKYSPAFTSTSATGFASADPGVLRVFASDLVVALPLRNAPNLPVTPNTNTVYANIEVVAGFTDYLTVNSLSQAVGTPVQVPFHYAAEVISDTVLGYPPYSAHPLAVSVSFNFPGWGTQSFTTEHYGYNGFPIKDLPNGNFLHSIRSDEFFVNAHVGDVLAISALISMYGSPRLLNGNDSGAVMGAWADGRNTAGIWLGALPDDTVMTSASGHDYRIDPTLNVTPVAPVPVTATANAGDARAIVNFIAPVGTGGSAVIGYTVTSSPDGITATGTRSPIAVLGLTNGTAYTFTVTARNATGISTTSEATNSVTPTALLAPGPASPPAIGIVTAGDAQATVNFTTPANDGGSPIIDYTVTSFPDGITADGTASPITVMGLTNGIAYTFTVIAHNASGMSAASASSASVTPDSASVPPPALTTAPATGGGGGGSASMLSLLVLSAAYWLRRFCYVVRDRRDRRRFRGCERQLGVKPWFVLYLRVCRRQWWRHQ